MKKRTTILFMVILLSRFLIAEPIPRKQYLGIIKTIEAYINKSKKLTEKEVCIFECERNADYHSGYKHCDNGYYLGNDQYEQILWENVPLDTIIVEISLDYNAKNIIIVFRKDGKWYGYNSKILIAKNGIKIKNIPKELNELD